jgi:ATP-dependent DNA ligase
MSRKHIFETLYGLDKKGQIREWNIKIVESKLKEYTQIVVLHGMLNGKQIETITKIEKGKNIGKKNETCHYNQALSDATSKWNRKKDIDQYTTTIPKEVNSETTTTTTAAKSKPPSPMLAHDYKKFKHKLQFPCFIQKKYDGYRLLYDPETDNLYTRNGKKYDILYNSQIHKQLQKIGLPFDGELYCHADFNFECYGVLRKKKINQKDLLLLDKIEYHVYDIHTSNDLTYKERYKLLSDTVNKFNTITCKGTSKIKPVETYLCNSINEINNYHTQFIHDNYEGSIVRNSCSLYESKRSFNLLKYKDFDDDEFLINGFTTEKDNDINLIIWICKTKDDKTFNIRPQGTKEEREHLYTIGSQFIGQKLWVKFFGYTENKIPRFPTTKTNSFTTYIRNVVE